MLHFLTKLFVLPFYQRNTGFFLFFFFFFFGVVNAGSLVAYHVSLMVGMLESPVILGGVLVCWLLYHWKCTSYCLSQIRSEEGSFLYTLQTLLPKRQLALYSAVHLQLYAPVLAYSVVVMVYGARHGYTGSVVALVLFQLAILALGTLTYYYRINYWMRKGWTLPFSLVPRHQKPLLLCVLYYLSAEKKVLFLSLKATSLALLYIVLVLNKDGYDHHAFIYFFQLILLSHTLFPFLAVRFLESRLSFYRNLPLPLTRYAGIYVVTHTALFLPELLYLLLQDSVLMPVATIVAYYCIGVATLCLLTAVQYAEHMERNEYVKVVFALFFVSTFALHAQAFWWWTGILLFMAVALFWSGFYRYEGTQAIE